MNIDIPKSEIDERVHQEIQRLNGEVGKLKQKLTRMTTERDRLKVQVASHEALIEATKLFIETCWNMDEFDSYFQNGWA